MTKTCGTSWRAKYKGSPCPRKPFVNVLLICLILLLLPSSAATIPSLLEEVDVSSLSYITTILTYSFPDDGELPKQSSLERRCTTLPHALSCGALVDTLQRRVVFTVVVPGGITVEDLQLTDGQASTSFALTYRPLQFTISPGIFASSREIIIRYPSHETIIGGPLDTPIRSTFVVNEDTRQLQVDVPGGYYDSGDVINLPSTDGILCIGALMDGDNVIVLSSSQGCESFFLSVPQGTAPGTYELVMLSLDTGKADFGTSPVTINKQELPFEVDLQSDGLSLGEPIIISVTTEEQIDRCQISLVSPDTGEIARSEFEDCSRMALGTSTTWVPGRYQVRITGITWWAMSTVTVPVDLVGLAPDHAEIVVDREDYRPGDDVVVKIESSGESCETSVLDDELNAVTRTEGCGERSISLDETISPGPYIVQARVYSHGRLTGMASRVIEVQEWEPVVSSPMESLCHRGSFLVDGEPIACLLEGQHCSALSTSIPGCLCFDNSGEPVAACRPTDICDPHGCQPQPRTSPYIIVQIPGSCKARQGSKEFDCITLGEVCSGHCLCMDERGPISSCNAGQTCTLEGCIETELEFETRIFTPNKVSSSDIADGITLTWTGIVRFEDVPLDSSSSREVSSLGRVGFLQPQNATVDVTGTMWSISLPVEGRITPGDYDAVVEIHHRERISAVRRAIKVLYPLEDRELTVKVRRFTPSRIDAADLLQGVSIRLELEVNDKSGNPVEGLSADDIDISLDKLEPVFSSASYDHESGTWIVIATFQSSSPPASNYIKVSVWSFGRNGAARMLMDVVGDAPAAMHISHINPGTADRPLFNLLLSVGFSIEVHLTLSSLDTISEDDFTVTLDGTDITKALSHSVSTEKGVKLHLTRIRLPPGPSRGRSLELTVTMDSPGGELSDSVPLMLEGNPGNWKNMRGGAP